MFTGTKWLVAALATAVWAAPAIAETTSSTSKTTEQKTTYGSSSTDTGTTAPDTDTGSTTRNTANSGAGLGPTATGTDSATSGSPAKANGRASAGEAATTLSKLHAGNQAEIAAGKWMEDHAQDSKVKGFAKKMVKDHGSMDRDVMALAKKKGVDLTSHASGADAAQHQDQMQSLKDMPAGQADREYMTMMVKDHQHDISEVHAARQSAGSDQDLAKLLDKTGKKMEDHLKDAQKIQRDLSSRQARNPKR